MTVILGVFISIGFIVAAVLFDGDSIKGLIGASAAMIVLGVPSAPSSRSSVCQLSWPPSPPF